MAGFDGEKNLNNIINLLVDTATTLLAAVFLLRFWSQVARMRPPEQLVNFTLKLTNWLVLPMRRLLPGAGGYDWPCLFGAVLMAVLATLSVVWGTQYLTPKFVILLSVQQIANWILYGFMLLLLMEVIFSWVNPNAPIASFIHAMNDPILRPVRRIIPPIGGIDLSVFAAMILLQVLLQLISMGLAQIANMV